MLVLVGAYFVVQAITKTGGGGTITAPNLVGRTLAEAQTAAKAQNAKLQVTQVDTIPCPDATIKKDQVCTQEPAANQPVPADNTIKLHISGGPTTAGVPDVTGKTSTDATSLLTAQGFVAGNTVYQDSDSIPQDQVISQNPPGGQQAAPGATIILTVSSGQSKVAVPNVVGQQSDAAQSALTTAGFQVTVKTKPVTDPAQQGVVQSQTPTGSTKKGATITITVGKAPDKVAVPILVGKTFQQASDLLTSKGLTGVVVLGPQDGNAQVINADPPAGTQVDPGTQIKLWTIAGAKGGNPNSSSPPPNGN